ncbi:MAG: hypothetical protein OXR73_00190 [Myxococcales bacterium]|nr:hypothetical protein [Myxococcales bacterium]
MGLFGKLLGRKGFDELKAEADRLMEAGEHGAAKLAYEKASDAKDATAEQRDAVLAQAATCCDAIAEARLSEAQRLLAEDELDLAMSELDHALHTAVSETLQERVRVAIDNAQRSELHEQLEVPSEQLDREARYETLGGHWEFQQHAEYASYGDALKDALLMLHDGQIETGHQALEALLETARENACYLWFEVARARLSAGEDAHAAEAFKAFLARLGPDEGSEARLAALMSLAALRHEADDVEGALAYYQDALEAMPEDPRTYLAMGSVLRLQGLAEEAVDILTSGLAVLDEGQAHFRLWHESGLAHADAGHDDQAIHYLEQVVEFFATRQQSDLPPEGTSRLAELHERRGNLARAADLYRMLSAGSDVAHLLIYHRHAARLLAALGQSAEARKMLVRARELVPEEAVELAAEIDSELAQVPQ